MQKEITGREVDITPLFQEARIPTGTLKIIETVGMYPYKNKVKDNWAYYTAVGCKRLKEIFDKEGRKIENIGIVGICSGVEGIAVLEIFQPELKKLIITDIDNGILDGTVFNIGNVAKTLNVEVVPLKGSFCEPILEKNIMVDFVHANIPNLPSTGEEDLTKGAEKGTFLPESLYEGYDPPRDLVGWALGAQFAYLESAKKVVPKGGSVITELGGRVPWAVVERLFGICGLELREVITGFKEQTEALIDFIGYHRMEELYGVEFEFYLFKEGQEVLEKKGLANPTYKISGKELKELLEPFKVSAGQALELYKQGKSIGHTVHIFRGIKRGN